MVLKYIKSWFNKKPVINEQLDTIQAEEEPIYDPTKERHVHHAYCDCPDKYEDSNMSDIEEELRLMEERRRRHHHEIMNDPPVIIEEEVIVVIEESYGGLC